MSKRNTLLFVLDMQAPTKVDRYTVRLSYEAFAANDLVLDAVVRNLEIIGEAARPIPEELRRRYAYIDWRRVISFRNIAKYFGCGLGNRGGDRNAAPA